MKRTFTYLFLLLLVLLVCGKQAYNLLISNESIRNNPTGALSDIADEVIAIPLQDSGTHSIKEAKYIRQEGDNLFLISNETLYRFNRKGEFICRITHPDDIRVAGYVVNPANQQLIVLGNTDDIFYYSFNGDLLTRKKLKCDLPENRHMLSISMHNNRIFTTEECVQQGKPLRLRNRSLNTIPLSINYNLIRSVRSIWNVPHARSVVSPRK